jgi:hypothetical protein
VWHFIKQIGVSYYLLTWFQDIANYFGAVIHVLNFLPFLRSKLETNGHTMGRGLSIHQPIEDVSLQSLAMPKSA